MFPEAGVAPEHDAAMGERQGIAGQALRSLAMRLRGRWRELIRAELARHDARATELQIPFLFEAAR